MPKCHICAESFKVISATHLLRHQLTSAQYRQRYPDASFRDADVGKRQGAALSRKYLDPEFRLKMQDAFASADRSNARSAASKLLKLRWSEDASFRDKMALGASQRLKLRWKTDPGFKAKMASVNTARWDNELWRLRRTTAFKEQRGTSAFQSRLRTALRKAWTPKRRQEQAANLTRQRATLGFAIKQQEAARAYTSTRWLDPKYQKLMAPHVSKWTTEERIVRGWLKQLAAYQTGTKTTIGFLPHRWLPTAGAKFSANGDFVDYNHRCVIHVDGTYWHQNERRFPDTIKRDLRTDLWCQNNSWNFLRLTDTEIHEDPTCFDRLKRFIASCQRSP